jgi:hypothetical protein
VIVNRQGIEIEWSGFLNETLNPQWNHIFTYNFKGEEDEELELHVWDDDHRVNADDDLGFFKFNVREFLEGHVNGGSLQNGTGQIFIHRTDDLTVPVIPNALTQFDLTQAAFMELVVDQGNESTPIIDRLSIYVSTFNPINSKEDPKYYIRSPGRHLTESIWPMVELDRTAFWPNNPDPMPKAVVGVEGIVWTSGFLVPGKTEGKLELYDTSSSSSSPNGPINIAALDEIKWYYHRVVWKDMNSDGHLDALTARFNKPLVGKAKTELVWLENPGLHFENLTDGAAAGWTQHLILSGGPDVHFRNLKITAAATGEIFDCIIAAEFWNERLVIYYTTTGDWNDLYSIFNITIDSTLGQTFDLYIEDINLDGNLDIIVTAYNHTLGNLFAYEIPAEDFRTGVFTKHVIADGFKANTIIGGQSMTPGGLKPFHPFVGHVGRPYIMLSGDDDGNHYIIKPVSPQDPSNWLYTKHLLVDSGKTTSGKFVVGDLDGDGWTEIVAAGYTAGKIYVFSYAPMK